MNESWCFANYSLVVLRAPRRSTGMTVTRRAAALTLVDGKGEASTTIGTIKRHRVLSQKQGLPLQRPVLARVPIARGARAAAIAAAAAAATDDLCDGAKLKAKAMAEGKKIEVKLRMKPNVKAETKSTVKPDVKPEPKEEPVLFENDLGAAQNVVASGKKPKDEGTVQNMGTGVKTEVGIETGRESSIGDLEDAPPTLTEAYAVLDALKEHFSWTGPPTDPQRPVLDGLIRTVLSQATSNSNSSRALRSLHSRFPSWEAVLNAGIPELATTIRSGGLADAKAAVIIGILQKLQTERGVLSLEHLRQEEDASKIREELQAFHGVGPKTAACVVAFTLRRPDFPVDTHVRRVTTRLGWAPPKSSAERIYAALNAALPDDGKFGLHVLLIELGRKTCKPRAPRCAQCPLQSMCRTGRAEASLFDQDTTIHARSKPESR